MRTSSRISRIVLAGTLLAGLGLGPVALASQPAAAEAAGAETATASAGVEVSTSLKTVRDQGVQFQVDASLAEDANLDGSEGPVYTYLMGEVGMTEVDVLRGDYSSLVDVVAADPGAYVAERYGVEGVQVLGAHLRMLDGAPRYCVEFSYEVEGQEVTGALTMLLGGKVGAVASVLWNGGATDEEVWSLEQIGRSLSFTEETQAADGGATGAQEPAASAAPVVSDGSSATVELPGWTLQVGTDPAGFLYTTVDSWDDAIDGKGVIGVPVRVTNTGTEPTSPWWGLTNHYYGPSGIEQANGSISAAGYSFDDSLESVPSLRAGASADAYVYFYDEGDGEYVAEFTSWDAEYNTLKEEVSFTIAR